MLGSIVLALILMLNFVFLNVYDEALGVAGAGTAGGKAVSVASRIS